MKKIVLIGLFILTSLAIFAQPAGVPQGLQYSAGTQGITITGYTGNARTLVIPAEIEGLPVLGIRGSVYMSVGTVHSGGRTSNQQRTRTTPSAFFDNTTYQYNYT